MTPGKKYVPPRVAAQALGVSPAALGQWRRDGLIPWVPVGAAGQARFCVEDVREALAALNNKGQPCGASRELLRLAAQEAVDRAQLALDAAVAHLKTIVSSETQTVSEAFEEKKEESNQLGLQFDH